MALFKRERSFFGKLSDKISDVVHRRKDIDDELFDELEEVLITSDIGMETTMNIIEDIRGRVRSMNLKEAWEVKKVLKDIMIETIDKGDEQKMSEDYPLVIMMIGINGGGKTTTIGKLANMYKKQGKKVLIAAADTFRAAAAEQLEIWSERVGTDIIRHQEGADPSAVLFDAARAAKARGTDVLICDTAGRLQNKKNLMDELKKMNRILSNEYPEATRETLLVLDATTGKNAVSQAKEFSDAAEVTGVVITKLDGTAKGGIALTIADEFNMPIKFVGVGEGIDDLKLFDAKEFIGGIFDE